MKRSPLYKTHLRQGAKIVPFADWEMPLSYSGVIDEHRAVREAVGLFDVGHMGRFELFGPGSEAFLDRLTPGPIRCLSPGGAQYSMLLRPDGGILDDIYLYKKEQDRYLLIVNASNRTKDFQWILGQKPPEITLKDITEETALMALQGPKSWEVLRRILPPQAQTLRLRSFMEAKAPALPGGRLLIGRTGYTGERGYELLLSNAQAEALWQALMRAGAAFGIKAAGLGARDTLRLEMGYPLYGHEMDERTTPLEAGLGAFVDFGKDFIGRKNLERQRETGLKRKQIAFELLALGVPREGCRIFAAQKEVGKVSSGNYAPSLKKGIGMGYVESVYSGLGSKLFIDIRGKRRPAIIVKKPFYRKKNRGEG